MAVRTIILKGTAYSYELVKSRRKSIAIQIKPEGAISVKAPLWVSIRDIEGYVYQKENWIVETLHRVEEIQSQIKEREFITGDSLLFMGKEYILEVKEEKDRKRSNVKITPDRIVLTVALHSDSAVRKTALEHWYREQARTLLTIKAEQFSAMLNVKYADIRIKDQKSRWGSCSAKGNLNFNWHIISAPEAIADYLVIHELCHLRYMNHSPEFWNCVASLCPDYKTARKWLREKGATLKNW